ncbi:MAG: 4Fe-4S binding protein [Desulfuromusa sp.]|nr:4Fe-4S binding protein [Desulfuromusa sp.]
MAVIVLDNCTGCGVCVAVCPYSALSLETELPNGFGGKKVVVDSCICHDCGNCLPACRYQAIISNIKTPSL